MTDDKSTKRLNKYHNELGDCFTFFITQTLIYCLVTGSLRLCHCFVSLFSTKAVTKAMTHFTCFASSILDKTNNKPSLKYINITENRQAHKTHNQVNEVKGLPELFICSKIVNFDTVKWVYL